MSAKLYKPESCYNPYFVMIRGGLREISDIVVYDVTTEKTLRSTGRGWFGRGNNNLDQITIGSESDEIVCFNSLRFNQNKIFAMTNNDGKYTLYIPNTICKLSATYKGSDKSEGSVYIEETLDAVMVINGKLKTIEFAQNIYKFYNDGYRAIEKQMEDIVKKCYRASETVKHVAELNKLAKKYKAEVALAVAQMNVDLTELQNLENKRFWPVEK